jgi:hypothetical protein
MRILYSSSSNKASINKNSATPRHLQCCGPYVLCMMLLIMVLLYIWYVPASECTRASVPGPVIKRSNGKLYYKWHQQQQSEQKKSISTISSCCSCSSCSCCYCYCCYCYCRRHRRCCRSRCRCCSSSNVVISLNRWW